MARGGLPGMVSGTKVRAARGEAPLSAGARIVKAAEATRDAIKDGTLIEHHPEVVGVRVYMPYDGKKPVDYPMGRDFIDINGGLLVRSADGVTSLALYPMGRWDRAELMFAPAKRRG
jgi:hypothetical protein